MFFLKIPLADFHIIVYNVRKVQIMLDNFRKVPVMPELQETGKKARKRRLNALEVVRLQALCRDRLVSELYRERAYPGMPIPGVKTLSEQYAIPLSVVRSTLNALRAEGVLESVPREGMKVVSLPSRPKSLKGIRIAMIAELEESNPDYVYNRSAEIATGMDRILNEQGGHMDFFNLWQKTDPDSFFHQLSHSGYDALIVAISRYQTTDFLREYPFLTIPCISIDCNVEGIDCVDFDDEQIGHRIARHALELGHRRTLYYHYSYHSWSEMRLKGIRKEFAAWGVPAPDVVDYPFVREDHEDFVSRNFDRIAKGNYTFVMAANDRLAKSILLAARRRNLRIPGDFSLSGVDDSPFFRDLNLTTVSLHSMDLGLAALELLKRRLVMPESHAEPEKVLVPCPLIVRNTTGKITGEIFNEK